MTGNDAVERLVDVILSNIETSPFSRDYDHFLLVTSLGIVCLNG